MRITGGVFRGRLLAAPRDMAVRPTSDRTRQAIFNMLMHKDFGSGFALEGAAVADLVADSADSRALQRQNVETLNLTGATRIWRRDATDLGPLAPTAGGPFQLVFLDPPYRKGLGPKAMASLLAGGWLAPGALLVVETEPMEPLEAPGYRLLDERDYGETRVRFLTQA
jgi:16S rRNA (guanine966-N2)-methyltransferase